MKYENDIEELIFVAPIAEEEGFVPRDCEWGWPSMWGEG
jgi:hypothetical protein